MRLFIAVLFPDDIIDRLSSIRDALHDASRRGTFVQRENLHLTLEFLGECDNEEKGKAIRAMERLCFPRFTIRMDRIGLFSRPDGDTWWVGAGEAPELVKVQRELHSILLSEGFMLEKRKFKPHITLGRNVISDASIGRIDPIGINVESISLMLSERIGGRMVYTELFWKSCL